MGRPHRRHPMCQQEGARREEPALLVAARTPCVQVAPPRAGNDAPTQAGRRAAGAAGGEAAQLDRTADATQPELWALANTQGRTIRRHPYERHEPPTDPGARQPTLPVVGIGGLGAALIRQDVRPGPDHPSLHTRSRSGTLMP